MVAITVVAGGGLLLRQAAASSSPANVASSKPDSPPVAVQRSDVTPVVTLDAKVTSRPTYVVSTPIEGTVTKGVAKPGEEVPAGSVLYAVDGSPMKATTDCIVGKWLTDGVRVPAGLPVVSCTYPGFGLTAPFPPDNAYTMLSGQLQGRGQINNGPGPFDCPILSAPSDAAQASTSGQPPGQPTASGVGVVCAIPPGVRGLAGVGALVAVRSTLVVNALVLPRSAVQGSVDSGVVNLLVSGVAESRTVTLGVTDGNIVQILTGLAEGDLVSPTPPTLRGS